MAEIKPDKKDWTLIQKQTENRIKNLKVELELANAVLELSKKNSK